ncbi:MULTISPECIES: hypothetical protein [Janibacter]|nr:hypothetical protein [Janibacter melonis]
MRGLDLAMPEVPLARVAWMRRLVYPFVIFDVLVNVTDPIPHGDVPAELYRELPVRALLGLPAPSPGYVRVLLVVIVLSALVAALGRLPRLAGAVCGLGMLDWMSNAFSYSKIDHDHFALMVALLVLPTVGAARAGDLTPSRAAGWALRMIQMGVVATYFLSAVAKMRFGTWLWANGSTFVWAFSRRGNDVAQWLAGHPALVHLTQWSLLGLEFVSPVLLWLRGRGLAIGIGICFAFHATTAYLLHIHFLPLVVCLFAFLPLERLGELRRGRARPARAGRARPRAGSAAPSSAR